MKKLTVAVVLSVVCFVGANTSRAQEVTRDLVLNPDDEQVVVRVAMSDKWIGVLCRPVDESLRKHLHLADDAGLVVEQVVPSSPAERSGLQVHDILTHANEQPLSRVDQLVELTTSSDETGIRFRVVRAGEALADELVVKPEKRPQGVAGLVRPKLEGEQLGVPEMGKVRAWLKQLEDGDAVGEREAFEFRFFGPGMALRNLEQFPSGVSIQIERHNDGPAKIKVTRDESTWEVTEDSIDQLPEDLQDTVKQMLGGGGVRVFQGMPEGLPGPGWNQRFDEMNERIEKMLKELHELRKEQSSDKKGTIDA